MTIVEAKKHVLGVEASSDNIGSFIKFRTKQPNASKVKEYATIIHGSIY
jgi:hypothetical protein